MKEIYSRDAINYDNKSESKVVEKAKERLSHVGLTLSDLEGKRVLDLGSGANIIARGAKIDNIDADIISLDMQADALSSKYERDRSIVADSKKIPIEDNSIDTLISLSSVSLPENTWAQEDVEERFKEIERVIAEDGEARINTPSFEFIKVRNQTKELKHLEDKYHAESINSLDDEQQVKLYDFYQGVVDDSIDFLKEQGYKVEYFKPSESPTQEFEFSQHYIILKKSE